MPKQTRKRTAAQRKVEEKPDQEYVRPISEEEQEAEINALKKKNADDRYTARMYLDVMVAFSVFVTARQAWRYISTDRGTPLIAVTVAQTLLLPLSLSPSRLPIPGLSQLHPIITAVQVAIFMFAFVFLRNGEEGFSVELLRWALPELAAGAVEVQRRAEISSEIAIAKLEKLKYPLKGA